MNRFVGIRFFATITSIDLLSCNKSDRLSQAQAAWRGMGPESRNELVCQHLCPDASGVAPPPITPSAFRSSVISTYREVVLRRSLRRQLCDHDSFIAHWRFVRGKTRTRAEAIWNEVASQPQLYETQFSEDGELRCWVHLNPELADEDILKKTVQVGSSTASMSAEALQQGGANFSFGFGDEVLGSLWGGAQQQPAEQQPDEDSFDDDDEAIHPLQRMHRSHVGGNPSWQHGQASRSTQAPLLSSPQPTMQPQVRTPRPAPPILVPPPPVVDMLPMPMFASSSAPVMHSSPVVASSPLFPSTSAGVMQSSPMVIKVPQKRQRVPSDDSGDDSSVFSASPAVLRSISLAPPVSAAVGSDELPAPTQPVQPAQVATEVSPAVDAAVASGAGDAASSDANRGKAKGSDQQWSPVIHDPLEFDRYRFWLRNRLEGLIRGCKVASYSHVLCVCLFVFVLDCFF